MWWVKDKEAKGRDNETRGTTGSAFEDTARQFSESPRPEESSAPLVEKEEKLNVKIEFAQGALEYCFVPLARLDHPAWALTELESAKGAPAMQAFLQMVADKLAPALLARVVNKYPEFADLVAMLGVLYYQKYRLVRSLKIAEAEAAKRAGAGPANTSILTPDQSEEKIHCDECGKDFDTQALALGHLPCPGKIQ
jgi:hypothetical protein